MKLEHYATGTDLVAAAGSFLREREIEHSLLLTLANRIGSSNEAGGARAYLATAMDGARVVGVALRTPPHNLVLSYTAPEEILTFVDLVLPDLHARGSILPGVYGPPEVAGTFAREWARTTAGSAWIRKTHHEFEIERVVWPRPSRGSLRPAEGADIDLLVKWANAFIDETGLPEEDRPMATHDAQAKRVAARTLFVWQDDDVPVSMATCSGATRVPRIGLVYTPPHARSRGYASSLVAHLTQRALDAGAWRVALSTDASNPTSNRIYKAIGYRFVAEAVMYAF